MSDRWANEEIIWVDVQKIISSWRTNDDNFLDGPQHDNAIGKRYEGFGKWLEKGITIQPPEIHLAHNGEISFNNGRHRFTWMANHGVKTIPASVPKEDVEEIRNRFGV